MRLSPHYARVVADGRVRSDFFRGQYARSCAFIGGQFNTRFCEREFERERRSRVSDRDYLKRDSVVVGGRANINCDRRE